MPSFGDKSKERLKQLHPDLQRVLNEAIKHVDFSITCGYRGQIEQDKAFAEGKSKVKYPNGKHNKTPSEAVDVAPFPLDWSDEEAFIFLNGFICGIGTSMGIKLRSGVTWDNGLKTGAFVDAPHLEIMG